MTETTNPKTRTLGVIDATKAKKVAGFEAYSKAAAALNEARQQTTAAKTKVKQRSRSSLVTRPTTSTSSSRPTVQSASTKIWLRRRLARLRGLRTSATSSKFGRSEMKKGPAEMLGLFFIAQQTRRAGRCLAQKK